MKLEESLFMRTIRGEAVERPPIWIMRQAGRYMPEYQAIRKNISFLDLCKDVDKATEVTMLPMDMLNVDAAIVFSDILIPAEAMGFDVSFGNGGPKISNPFRSADDLKRVRIPDPATDYPWALETIARVQAQIDGKPCLGFAGAPFTMASYVIEGQTSKSFNKIKAMMYSTPGVIHDLLEKITETVGIYLEAQLEAGAPAVQLFDTWAGSLSRADYLEFALPYHQNLRSVAWQRFDGHLRQWQRRTSGPPPSCWSGCGFRRLANADRGSPKTLGPEQIIQGNLEPCSLYAPPERIAELAIQLIEQAGRDRHIFNLGHGILPDVPVPHAKKPL